MMITIGVRLLCCILAFQLTWSYDYGYRPVQSGGGSPSIVDAEGISYRQMNGGMPVGAAAHFSQNLLAHAIQGDQMNGVKDPAALQQLNMMQHSQQQSSISNLRKQKYGNEKLQAFMTGHDAPMSEVERAIDWMKKNSNTPTPDPPPPAFPIPLPTVVIPDAPAVVAVPDARAIRGGGLSTASSNDSDFHPANQIVQSLKNEVAPMRKPKLKNRNIPLHDETLIKLRGELADAMSIQIPEINLSSKKK